MCIDAFSITLYTSSDADQKMDQLSMQKNCYNLCKHQIQHKISIIKNLFIKHFNKIIFDFDPFKR